MTDPGAQDIAGYRVLQRLGAGGMGEVYLVQHPRLPRRDALKLLDGGVSRNEEFRSRFQREADVLAPLSHANITTLYDRGEWEGRLWLTMEYIAGRDGAQLLQERGPLPLGLVTEIIAGAGAALDYAYAEHAVTHRDVKPANILVAFAADGRLKTVKLADFGIAKAAIEATSLTSTGVTVGTVSYLSPEAIEGRPLDNRADIYSLGCTAFQLLTGALPFTGTSIVALMSAHLHHPVPAITAWAPHLPVYLNDLFARVLAKNPDERYQSCVQFVQALRGSSQSTPPVFTAEQRGEVHPTDPQTATLLDHTQLASAYPHPVPASFPPYPEPKRRPRRRRRRRAAVITVAAVAGLAAITLVAAFGLGLLPGRSHKSPPPPEWASRQTELPFPGLREPRGVAVDSAGNVYVADFDRGASGKRGRVLKLAAGSTSPVELPFFGLDILKGLAVDGAENVYVVGDAVRDHHLEWQVLKLAPGADKPTQLLAMSHDAEVEGVAVDGEGNVFFGNADSGRLDVPWRVQKLAPGSPSPTELPFTGLHGVRGVAVDPAGDIYVLDQHLQDNHTYTGRVFKLAAGSTSSTELPAELDTFSALDGITVDVSGNIYVADDSGLTKLSPGSALPTTWNARQVPRAVAVDNGGAVYVAETDLNNHGNVVKLAPG